MLVEGQVGPVVAQDGTQQQLRQARDSALVVNDAHGRYYEPTVRGQVFSASGPPLGGTAGASTAGAMTLAAASIPLGALWNPAGSSKNVVVLRSWYSPMSGTTSPAQAYWYVGVQTAPITTGTKLTVQANNGSASASVCTAYGPITGTAAATLTGAAAANVLRPFGSNQNAAPANGGLFVEENAGDIVVPPGTLLQLAGAVAASAFLWTFGAEWEEVAV